MKYRAIIDYPKATAEEKRHLHILTSSFESAIQWATEIFYPTGMNLMCPKIPKEEWSTVTLRIYRRTEVIVCELPPDNLNRIDKGKSEG